MKISDMVEVLQAAERGEVIEYGGGNNSWLPNTALNFDFKRYDYRIAPKKRELSLVEELRTLNPQFYSEWKDIAARAADRIEDLERSEPIIAFTTNELLVELGRRMLDRTVKEME